jgi:hypothetical protein
MDLDKRMSYWLLPSEPELSDLTVLVGELADRFNGPKFQPHVTIYHGEYDVSDPVDALLEKISNRRPIELLTKSLNFGQSFTQSCFIEFENSKELLEIRELVIDTIKSAADPADFPHLSLFYGSLSSTQRVEISRSISIPKSIKFDVVKAIANRGKTKTREDVEYWNECARRSLTSSL